MKVLQTHSNLLHYFRILRKRTDLTYRSAAGSRNDRNLNLKFQTLTLNISIHEIDYRIFFPDFFILNDRRMSIFLLRF